MHTSEMHTSEIHISESHHGSHQPTEAGRLQLGPGLALGVTIALALLALALISALVRLL